MGHLAKCRHFLACVVKNSTGKKIVNVDKPQSYVSGFNE